MKVYLAAPYSAKDLVVQHAADLRALGVVVTSSWLEEPWAPTTQMHELTHEEHQQYALNDVRDVANADVLIFHVDQTKSIIRAGRHVEFGIAVGLGLSREMPILVVGDVYENIFHHLPQVTHYAEWSEVLAALPNWALQISR